MNTEVEEIKSRVDIVELIQGYIRLERSGINWRACCPFHAEKTPSFFVSPTRQTWHCFGGCAEGGDIFSFVQKIEGVDFREALETLAKRAGVDLRREDPGIRSEKTRLLLLCDEAAKYFAAALAYYPVVGVYLTGRGVLPETIKEFRIGYAPDGWRNLLGALAKKRFRPEEIEKAGLAIRSEKGFYDRFRNRVMFPVADASGRIVGFGGRIFDAVVTEAGKGAAKGSGVSGGQGDAGAKYINSPQSLIYDKSHILYAFDKAKKNILKENACVIVEGYMDAIMSHQAGVTHTIAVSGTALTAPQVHMIRRLADTLISSFDADRAGQLATKRSLDIAAGADFNRRVAVIPEGGGKDPADVVLRSPAEWVDIVKNAKPVVDFFLERALRTHDKKTPSGKKEIAREVLGEVRHLTNDIERAHWVQALARELEVDEGAIRGELAKIADGRDVPDEDIVVPAARSRRLLLEERILGLLLLHPEKRDYAKDFFAGFDGTFFSDVTHQAVFTMIMSSADEKAEERAPEAFAKKDAFIKDLIFQTEVMLANLEEKERPRELEASLKFLVQEVLGEECGRLARDIAAAERAGDPGLQQLMERHRAVSQKRETLA
ncbi:MAG: DNA primase [Candidatus Sungbacteria bacterium RIFCSPLOWO2_02_FULL_51_17]|uniref:DNA primase n=1 Tax=Candidatus Sungbacteria bacterium RIFCSPHIGHO2_02_FULL_51_29 TaxID=1802273 RepID=A0A1G2KQ24_9BACT|nr:MAG: DNA primase [Candidatus Sungbacteria bacterium RIFCSPHIGHO2_01_FULL_51_22]OHA01364.1 MAG: DNA primase [Candidatus Sungbacteria bacterium RIFCSPHIGHO2_02_FULL_51_29]OHA11765.1 MAG: DNA primase [Candidatus Sungbacteria bacterium RIFCSPLOWO2_02_FULL_51_17]